MKDKRTVLITGASSGIGAATCDVFQKNGWRVIGVARRRQDKKVAISRYIQADMSNEKEINQVISEVLGKEARLDALINNAAYQICQPIIKTSLQEWQRVYAVNVQAPFLLAKGLYKLLKFSKGAIVNVASVHAVATSANIGAYASSKGALLALTRNMAIEFAQDDVNVNAILPGAVDTPMLRDGLQRGHIPGKNSDELIMKLGEKHIIGRVGQPSEIGQAIFFLADKTKSAFITGQSLIIDGGALTKLSTE